MTAAQSASRPTFVSLFLALAVLILSAAWIGFYVRVYSSFQMDLDEAHHANRGLDVASAIHRASIRELWAETVKPDWYPPIHGYFLGAWFMLVSPSTASARLYATFSFTLLGLLLWLSVRQVYPKTRPLLYLTPVLFFIADDQHLIHAAMSMLEIPAMLLAMASLFFLVRSMYRPTLGSVLLTSTFAVLTFLTRYSHGIFLFITIGICYLIFSRREFKGQLFKIGLAWLPAALLLALWLFGLGQWPWLIDYAGAQPQQVGVWASQELLFYPRQLLQQPSGWLALILAGCEMVFWLRRRQAARSALPYLVFFLVSLILLSVRLNNVSRFSMVLLPPLWILATGGVSKLIELIKKPAVQYAAIGLWLILLAGLCVKNGLALPGYLDSAYENMNSGVNDAYQYIAQKIHASDQEHLNIVMLGNTDQWNGFGLHFYLQSLCMAENPECVIEVQDQREILKSWPPQDFPDGIIKQREQDAFNSADYVVVFAKTPVLPGGWQELDRKEFVFKRHMIGDRTFQVVILGRE